MGNLYLVCLAFLKVFKGMLLTVLISSVILIIAFHIREVLQASRIKSIYNRFIAGGLRK